MSQLAADNIAYDIPKAIKVLNKANPKKVPGKDAITVPFNLETMRAMKGLRGQSGEVVVDMGNIILKNKEGQVVRNMQLDAGQYFEITGKDSLMALVAKGAKFNGSSNYITPEKQ